MATHAALACDTTRVRCGSLVYSVGYRHPAVLANAICTIDHLSGGRADFGIGAGWSQIEYDAYGIPFPPVKVRMDQLEEAIQCVRGLLREDRVDFEGEWFQLHDAQCVPKPVQPDLPIWVGGGGEKRTLRITAQWADGWNIPFVSPETFAHKLGVLHQHCDAVGPRPGRDPHRRQRRPGVDRREPAPTVRWPGRVRAARRADGDRRPRSSTASAPTWRPAPGRSTSPCGRRSTGRRSTDSPRRSVSRA